ncbi:rod shape-determining protein MreD [Marmoricola sp. Leaf446]|uniref:rod shape-determining protein MreD n=1 Tax=Marmoricola sp. Leaf446 TaxID=1736379 RepID=UPI0006F2A837|nr:rod shape-determining protein MreD [Marmoricola sp. Leaf446]KQT89701.1 rod shape-determining protein MreD [Marmoricola sp. Leaf446]
MSGLYRTLVLALVVVLAVVAQVAVLPVVAVNGVVPNLALLVVVAAALVRGPEVGVAVGFAAGLLLDLAPPAEHVAGRWALAFVLAAILAGRVRDDARDSPLAALATVGACSFVATSVFALSGQVLGDHAVPVGQMIGVVFLALLWDVVVAPLVLPVLMRLLTRSPARELAV